MRLPTFLFSPHRLASVHNTLSRVWLRNMSCQSYRNAIELLNSLQSNAAALEAARAAGSRANESAIPEMIEYLERIGYTPNDLNALNVIHITGTKGKGSTSAFIDSILRHARPEWKIGLYTSPHLVAVRERIRVNGVPLSEEQFAKFFFEVWTRLQQNTARRFENTPYMPGYFRFLTLLAYHAFLSLKVDATILEVGVGGAYDSTNIVPKPTVTGVTALGIDHVSVLGKTLEDIAWQKGGIYKEGVPAFTVEQPKAGLEVLRRRSVDLKASAFTIVPLVPDLSGIKLGLAGAHQLQNASFAIHLATSFLKHRCAFDFKDVLPATFLEGLTKTKWPGRCQTVVDPRLDRTTWYLDGAHTRESLECCIQWFVSPGVGMPVRQEKSESSRILIFNCTHGRSGPSLLAAMHESVSEQLALFNRCYDVGSLFNRVIFCTNVTFADGHSKGDLTEVAIPETELAELTTQRQLAICWSTLLPSFPSSRIHVLPTIEHAVQIVETVNATSEAPLKVLVTGSLHLVGGLIEAAGLAHIAL
ncbi:hypothetical protein AX17_001332 [Amanita inopinata Kibby_2008]|nr:hypothetical protein AX17_001332 [Amanita inopinata Kibby_2008]